MYNFYPRPPRGGRRSCRWSFCSERSISIHALREEGDARLWGLLYCLIGISIHALREEGDGFKYVEAYFLEPFLSTPSARRATVQLLDDGVKVKVFLSTPSARRATLPSTESSLQTAIFLSTPSARRATLYGYSYTKSIEFLSTPSARRATIFSRSAA